MVDSFEVWISMLFLGALILIHKLRGIVAEDHKESLNAVGTGFMILGVTSLIQLYDSLNIFNSIPFLSDPLFFRMVNWIGMITGLVFTVSGVSQWLPVSRAYLRYNQTRVNQLSLIKYVERLIPVESRTEIILQKTLEQMDELFDLAAGAILLHSRQSGSVIELARFDHERLLPSEIMSQQLLAIMTTEPTQPGNMKNNQEGWIENVVQPTRLIPLAPNGKICGVFLLWDNDNALSEDAVLSLKTAVDALTRMIERKVLLGDYRFNQRRERCNRLMFASIRFDKGIKANIPAIIKSLKRHLDFDFFSLTIVGDKTQRYAVGTNGSLLNEIGLDNETYSEQIEALMADRKPIMINNLENDQHGLIDHLLMNSGMRSLIAFPLTISGKINAVVMLAAAEKNWFSAQDTLAVYPALNLVNQLITTEQHQEELSNRARSQYRFSRFLNRISTITDIDEFMQYAANLMADEIGTTMVRISTIDPSGSFSDSRALVLQQPVKESTPAKGHMILSLMPLHREVIASRQLMLINQDNVSNHMSAMESSQSLFKELQSALLIPICKGDKVLGIISMGEKRNWTRFKFERQHIQLAESVAAALTLCLASPEAGNEMESTTAYEWPERVASNQQRSLSNLDTNTDMRSARSTSGAKVY